MVLLDEGAIAQAKLGPWSRREVRMGEEEYAGLLDHVVESKVGGGNGK